MCATRGREPNHNYGAPIRSSGCGQLGHRDPAGRELRKLTWDLVDLDRGVVHVWRSAGKSGDTKAPQSKRSLELPKRAITAVKAHKARQDREREAVGESWQGTNLVFCHEDGSMYTSALNWRFSKMTRKVGPGHWHAHEGRHTAVSIMSSNGVPSRTSATRLATVQPRHRDRAAPASIRLLRHGGPDPSRAHPGRHRPGTETWAAQQSRNLLMDLGERAAGVKFLVARPVRQ
jgi:integrase